MYMQINKLRLLTSQHSYALIITKISTFTIHVKSHWYINLNHVLCLLKILSCTTTERIIISFERIIISFEWIIISRERNNISRERNNISRERNTISRERNTILFERIIISFERNTISRERNIISRERNSNSHYFFFFLCPFRASV